MLLADDPSELISSNWSSRNCAPHYLSDRWREFSSIVLRLEPLGEQVADIGELWKRRLRLIEEIVEAPAMRIDDAVVKVMLLSFLISGGELQVALTPQCLEEYDRALVAEREAEQCVRVLDPNLWNACQRTRDAMSEAASDEESFSGLRWREFGRGVREIARHKAMTAADLRAKGEIFQEVLRFASATEGLGALQMSYLRDFRFLACERMKGKLLSVPHESIC